MVNNFMLILSGTIGSIGFALVFHAKNKVLFSDALGGIVCGIVYVVCRRMFLYSEFLSVTIASLCIASYSEIMARMIKEPAIVIFVPSIISLMPGSALYYTLSNAVIGEWALAKAYAEELAMIACGIVIGASVIWTFMEVKRRIKTTIMTKN